MTVTYTYKIISVDVAARCMEVIYSAEGYPTTHVSTRIPFEGEPLEYVITSFSPINRWKEQEIPLASVEVGTEGVINLALVAEKVAVVSARATRNALLMSSDWTQLQDAPILPDQVIAWAAYRQLLRDITDQADFPSAIIWPAKPGIAVTVL